jgi:hypothetical protein
MGMRFCLLKLTTQPPFSADVKSAWSYISDPPYAFVAWCSVKEKEAQEQLHFYFTFTVLCGNVKGQA